MKHASLALLWLTTALAQAASPAVEATLALPRTQPRHYVEAALALADLRATAEAEKIAGEFVALKLTDAQRSKLVDEVGAAALARLGRELPAAQATIDATLAAAAAQATSPKRLAALVGKLDGEREAALEAIRALRETGVAGVDYCVAALEKAEDPTLRARLREALVALDPISQPALFLSTGSQTEHVAAEAAYALGRLAELGRLRSPIAPGLVAGRAFEPGIAGDAARWAYGMLTGHPPTIDGAKRQIDLAIEQLLAESLRLEGGVTGPPNLEVQLAARLAADRERLDPTDPRAVRRSLVFSLESGEAGALETTPTYTISEALGDAIDLGLHRAAAACCEALGARGGAAALVPAGDGFSPLVRALESPHPTVRFAATEAVVALNASSPFAGSSRVADALLHFAVGEGEEVAVVASPQLGRAGESAGWLLGAGYAALPVNRGDDALRAATESPDTRLVLIDMSVSLPGARETIFRLRRSPQTALLPIAVLAADGRLAEAERLAAEHRGEAGRVLAVPRPHSPEAAASLAERLAAMTPADWPDAKTRLANAEAARKAIAKLAAEGPAFYGLDRRAEQVASIASAGADDATLGSLGTPEGQLRLLDAASLEARPLEARQAAAEAFAASVREHGVLLTTDQIRRQYDRYNLSATAPAETQEVLGGLLDAIERKNSEAPMTKPQ